MDGASEIGVGGRTHALMRDVNGRIRQLAETTRSERIEFFCECADPLCAETIALSVHEYDAARAHSSLVLVRPGHQVAGIGHVVTANERFAILETLGETARALDAPGGSA